jgi:hypothetical protein
VRLALATVVATLALAAPAQAVVSATGALERTSRTGLVLTITNNGDERFQIMSFGGLRDIAILAAPTIDGRGRCLLVEGNQFVCDGFDLAPRQSRRIFFRTSRPWPTGVSSFVTASQEPPGEGAGGPFPTTAPGSIPEDPVIGRSEVVTVLRGTVRVRLRGSRRFVRLEDATRIPDGSELDTRRGAALVTVAANRAGAQSSAEVSEGRAVIDQNRRARPTTTLRLSEPLACPRGASAAARKRRRLFVKTKGGRFRTRGNYAAGTAQGTAWRTTDTCTSTTIKVLEGTVRVRDLRERRTVRVRAPRSYTAER